MRTPATILTTTLALLALDLLNDGPFHHWVYLLTTITLTGFGVRFRLREWALAALLSTAFEDLLYYPVAGKPFPKPFGPWMTLRLWPVEAVLPGWLYYASLYLRLGLAALLASSRRGACRHG